jgi:hypothetical protein
MRWRAALAALVIAAAAVGIAVYAWPAAAKMPKPRAIDTGPPRQLPIAGALRGDSDAHDLDLSQLAPPGSRINGVWYAPAKGGHQRVLVRWTYRHRYALWGKFVREPRWGMTLWSFTGSRWQAARIPVVQGPADIRVVFADVTGDRRADLLFEQAPGTNHGCGPHEIFATSPHGVTTQAFSSYMCETTLRADHGLLALDLPYYVHNDSMCCWSYTEHLRLRWDGRKFVRESVRMQKNTFPWD